MKHRVIKRFSLFRWEWKYFLQEYYMTYADHGWDTIKEISKKEYLDLKYVI